MNSLLKKYGALILLMFCTLNAHADTAERRAERAAQRQEQKVEQRPERDVRQAEANTNDAQTEGNRQGSKMSPEERRALRRQINEAGRDLYSRDR